jgi:hypothetical protein
MLLKTEIYSEMQLGKFWIFLAYIILSIVSHGCTIKRDNDVYAKVGKGSRLTLQILRESKQIISNGETLILVMDISKDPDYTNMHLLFYTQSLILESATYLPAIRIDSMRNDILYAVLQPDKNNRTSRFRNDMTQKFKLVFLGTETNAGSRIGNKLVENIDFKGTGIVNLKVRKSKDLYATIRKSGSKIDDFGSFVNEDNISCLSWCLDFNYAKSRIIKVYNDANGRVFDEMIVRDREVLDRFYSGIILPEGK